MRAALLLALAALVPGTAGAQRLELAPLAPSATVGDVVAFRARLHLNPQQVLLDSVPRLTNAAALEGVRLVAADSMAKDAGGAWNGEVRFAFLRTGRQDPPAMYVTIRYIGAGRGAPVHAITEPVEIMPILPPGTEVAQDIRPPEGGGLGVLLLAAAAAVALAWAAAAAWRRRRRPAPVAAPAAAPPPPPGALEAALARLDAVAAEGWPARGDVARHYADTLDVLREYLHAIGWLAWPRVGHDELLDAVARRRPLDAEPHLLAQAEYVKFAAVRPDAAAAGRYLDEARALVRRWHAAAAERPDALR